MFSNSPPKQSSFDLRFTYDYYQEIRQYCNTLADGRLEASSVQIDPRCDYKASQRHRNHRHNNYNIDFLRSFSVTNPQNVTTSPAPPPPRNHHPHPRTKLIPFAENEMPSPLLPQSSTFVSQHSALQS